MALNLTKTVFEYLQKNSHQKFTAREIAHWIYQTHTAECQKKLERSQALNSQTELIAQIQSEIGSQRPLMQKKYSYIQTTASRPKKYYYTEKTESEEVLAAEDNSPETTKSNNLSEHDLYPRLSEFLWSEFSLYSKRIDEKRSSNKRGPHGNEWLYPDMVAMEDLSAEWHREVQACAGQYADQRTRLWSFEVKLLINLSNVRKCFFQAVSNSSWANFGYLVASEVNNDAIKELRMLSALHGIGLIQLDADNPAESQVMVPARERTNVDWDSVNRVTVVNKDFMVFVKQVRQFYQTGDPGTLIWDFNKKE